MNEKICEQCQKVQTYLWQRYYSLKEKGLIKEAIEVKQEAIRHLNWGNTKYNTPCECRRIKMLM